MISETGRSTVRPLGIAALLLRSRFAFALNGFSLFKPSPFEPCDRRWTVDRIAVVPSDFDHRERVGIFGGLLATTPQLGFTFKNWANSEAVRISRDGGKVE
jgi:hypothetical protein